MKSIETKRITNIPLPLLLYRVHGAQTNKNVQLAITNQIRKAFLLKVSAHLNDEDIETYMKIASNKYISPSSVELLFNKLLKANNKSKFLDQYLFKKFLSLKFLTFTSIHSMNCLQIFYKFLNSSMEKFSTLSFTYMKLFLKCLIQHSRAS